MRARRRRRPVFKEHTAPARILVIDDQPQTRYIFRRILTRAGFLVDEAGTATEGLQRASGADMIIADVNLPDMLGYDLCRRLKANPQTAGTPVLQISASFVSDESKVQALQGGADSYLVQPVEPAVLLAQVQAMLRLRKAESESSLSARQWQTTFDSLTDGLALTDADGDVLRSNRALLHMLEMTPSDIEGKPLASMFEQAFHVPFLEFLATHRDQSGELRAGGTWLRVRYDAVESEPGRPAGGILLLTDITEYKKLQETLKMSERLAATGRLAHIIAHEINNPLEAMANLLFLIDTTAGLQGEAHHYLEQATQELERISQITKQILAYHRESKDPLPASGNEVLEGVLAVFRSRMIGTGVTVLTSFGATRLVPIHPGEIRQAFGNLLSNALDALGSEGGRLHVRCFDALDARTGRRGVRFVFSDNGSGIAADVLPEIYRAFFTTKDVKGSGIGLWLTAEIVAKHQGHVRVRSRTAGPYRGTLFDVFLPAERAVET